MFFPIFLTSLSFFLRHCYLVPSLRFPLKPSLTFHLSHLSPLLPFLAAYLLSTSLFHLRLPFPKPTLEFYLFNHFLLLPTSFASVHQHPTAPLPHSPTPLLPRIPTPLLPHSPTPHAVHLPTTCPALHWPFSRTATPAQDRR